MHAVVTLQGELANKIDRVNNARPRVVQGSWDRVFVHAVVNLQELANKIDRAENAQTRIVQGSWDQGLRARCS